MAKAVRSGSNVFYKLSVAVQELDTKQARVGWFETSKYEDGTSVAYVAAIQEFGSPINNIPPRPFMRPAVAENKNQWREILFRGAKQILKGRLIMAQVLGLVAAKATGDISKAIVAVQSPPLKEATVKARLSRKSSKKITQSLRKPLVDTGLMLGSVNWVVENSSGEDKK